MVWAEFTRFTARPGGGVPDPHLHSHCFAFKLTHDDSEKRWKATVRRFKARRAVLGGGVWLAHRLGALGYATAKRDYNFEIAGTPRSLIDKFSRRRNAIEEEAAAKGVTDAEGKHSIGYWGRENKTKGVGKAQLRQEWDARLSDDERAALADAIHGPVTGDRVSTADEAKEYALAHSFENASAVSEERLKAEALKYAAGSVLPQSVADIAEPGSRRQDARRAINGHH